MPLLVTNETYNTLGSLYANAGDWIDCTFEFSTRFQVGSGTSSTFTYTTTGTQHFITSQGVDFGALGFVAGDTIDINWTAIQSGVNSTYSRVIDFVNGNNLFITTPLPSNADNQVFPTNGVRTGMSIIADKVPDAIETFINLTQNGTTSANSVIDGSTNRLHYPTVNTMSVTDVVSMVQLGDKSGGLLKDITLEYVANGNDGWKDWKISYTMFQWGVIKDGFSEPNYYDNTNCLAPFVKVKSFAQYGNPNGVLSGQSSNIEANTGGFNENFNGGVNNYATTSIVWTDLLGNVIDAVDYSNSSNFVATITQSVQNTTLSKYRIGMLFRPVDGSVYQNLNTNLGQNLIVNAPEVDFTHSTTPDLTIYSSYENSAGAGWDLTNLQFTQNSGTLTVSGTVKPNANAEAYFSQFSDGERLTTIWVSLYNFNTGSGQFSDRVSLQIFNSDNIDAPIKGVQIPNVVSQSLFDHNNNNITLQSSPQTTTEDDMLYTSDFRLIDNVDYEGIRTRIFAYNTVTNEEFTLENNFFSFANVVNINGQFQPNFTLNRGFNLPPTTDRNTIELKRKPSLDISGKYGIQLKYGYLNDWRYWLAQSGVDNDFFNITQSNNGFNKDWQHYSNSGNWIIRVSYYTSVNGVEDFNNYEAGIRTYEDDTNVTTINTFLIDSLGQNATSLLDDQIHTMTSVNIWNYNYLNAWGEVTIEDFESGNRWVISSVLNQGGIVPNPLKPIAGATALDLQIVGNIATAKCKIDTNYIDVDKVSVSTRIYSDANTGGQILNLSKEAEVAYSLRRVASSAIYSGACIRVRRSSDNTEQDIPFSTSNVLDLEEMYAFTGTDGDVRAYVTKWYDQSGNGNNATMTEQNDQPMIMNAGSVILSSNGLPAVSFADDYLSLDNGVSVGQDFYESFVFDRLSAGITSLSLGSNVSANPFCMLWSSDNSMLSGMEDSGSNEHATTQTNSGDFLLTTRRESLNNNVTMRRNGTDVGVVNYAIGTPAKLTTLGLKNNGLSNLLHSGMMQELIHYKADKSASQSFIETNTNNFYSIF